MSGVAMWSPRVQKALDNAAQREASRRVYLARTPYLREGYVVIPTPAKNDALVKRLRAAGFIWMGKEWGVPAWQRLCATPFYHNGYHERTSDAWLAWATDAHAEAFGGSEE